MGSNPYIGQLAPAVGGGLGGIPRRKGASATISPTFGTTWVQCTSAGSRAWSSSCAAKTSGFLAACVSGSGYIYTSQDCGVTWSQQTVAGLRDWQEICCSTDGAIVYATTNGGSTYKSSDYGVTFSALAGPSSGTSGSIACSDDGNVVAYRISTSQISVSTNGGSTFTTRAVAGFSSLSRICMSRDGLKIFCIDGLSVGRVSVSINYGVNWTAVTPVGMTNGADICCSGDGMNLIASALSGVYFSTNSGSSWEYLLPSLQANFVSCADNSETSMLSVYTSLGSNVLSTKGDYRLLRSASSSAVLPRLLSYGKCACNNVVYLQPVKNDYLYIS